MKILIAEDDFLARRLMQHYFSKSGTCDIAVNGLEAVELFKIALDEGNPYELICLDIMMPEMDGQTALKLIRDHERMLGIEGEDAVKILMTTALDDFQNITEAFNEQCEGYLVKPIDKQKIQDTLKKIGLQK